MVSHNTQNINNSNTKRVKGVCIKWIDNKAFGFVACNINDSDKDAFVHKYDLANCDKLNIGDKVSLTPIWTPNGRKGIQVVKIHK